MPALLTSIVFEEKTKDALLQFMADSEDASIAQDTLDAFANLERDSIPLDHLEEGHYTLVVKMSLERSTAAQFTLMASETHDVIYQTVFDLQPVIESGILYLDDYADAASGLLPGNSRAEREEAQARIDEISSLRTSILEGLMGRYVTNNEAFNEELLDVIDFATRPYVESKLLNDAEYDLEEEPAQAQNRILDDGYDPSHSDKVNHPLNRHLPHSKLLH